MAITISFCRGVPLSHLNLTTSMRNIVGTYKLTTNDRTLLVMPLFHIHGLVCGLLATLLSGGTVVIPQRFSASNFWSDFKNNQCNWYTAGNASLKEKAYKNLTFLFIVSSNNASNLAARSTVTSTIHQIH